MTWTKTAEPIETPFGTQSLVRVTMIAPALFLVALFF